MYFFWGGGEKLIYACNAARAGFGCQARRMEWNGEASLVVCFLIWVWRKATPRANYSLRATRHATESRGVRVVTQYSADGGEFMVGASAVFCIGKTCEAASSVLEFMNVGAGNNAGRASVMTREGSLLWEWELARSGTKELVAPICVVACNELKGCIRMEYCTRKTRVTRCAKIVFCLIWKCAVLALGAFETERTSCALQFIKKNSTGK